jgi:hypothetical protein
LISLPEMITEIKKLFCCSNRVQPIQPQWITLVKLSKRFMQQRHWINRTISKIICLL